MVQPINYMQDVQTPFQAAAQGLNFGAGIQKMQAQQQEQQLKIQAEQAAQEQQQAMRDRIQSVMSNPNPTAKDYAQLSMLMPKDQAESTRKAWDMLSADRQQAQLGRAGQVLAAFNSGANDIAQDLLKNEATALRNAGDEAGAKAAEVYAQIAQINPAMARTNIGLLLAQIPGGDKVIEGITKLGTERRAEEKAPAELSKAQSDAQKAAVAAKFAESDAVLEQQKKGWDITKLQEDIKINKMNAQIAAANAATNREGNSLKRQELGLKLQEMKDKRDTLVREKVADATEQANEIDSSRTLIKTLLDDEDSLRAATGGLGIRGSIPGTKARAAVGQLDQLSNQIAASKLSLLKGATSDKDIAFLKSINANLDRYQDEDLLIKEIKRIDQGLFELRQRNVKRSGMPDIAPSVSNSPAASIAPANLSTDQILKDLGVMK